MVTTMPLQQRQQKMRTSRRNIASSMHATVTALDEEMKYTMFDPLSKREQEVLVLIARGYSNQEIADTLVISIVTVKSHVSSILSRLHANNRTQAVAYAQHLGLLTYL